VAAPFRIHVGEFNAAAARAIVGDLVVAKSAAGFASQYLKQIDAWQEELQLLEHLCHDLIQSEPRSCTWSILLEYPIPRRNKYPDIVLLAEDVIFVIEMKVGSSEFDSAAQWQVEDYALDLRDFHVESQNRPIFPILVATQALSATVAPVPDVSAANSFSWPVSCMAPNKLALFLLLTYGAIHQPERAAIDAQAWDNSSYRPSLSIVEAAQELFAGHSVMEIAHAWADNLTKTTAALIRAIDEARGNNLRTLCFVTGIPGSGKTLAGLNAIHQRDVDRQCEIPSVFLSGNGPLVKIVREALVRDAVLHRGWSKKDAGRKVGTFIQNVHSFLGEYYPGQAGEGPHEHVVVFDEAQRAWSAHQMKAKKGVNMSEPRMMLEIMERRREWCVLVALVGGGQEIHRGEAGLEAWGQALSETKQHWGVFVSPEVVAGGESLAGHRLYPASFSSTCRIVEVPSLHLDVTIRSPRAQMFAEWVNLVLIGQAEQARTILETSKEFPVVLTRDLRTARQWLQDRSRFERRCGLVASSGAARLRAYGIEVSSGFRQGYPFEEWFLGQPGDVRSSYRLEVAATEFECQGLELDWVGVCWGDDLCIDASSSRWLCRRFAGASWQKIRQPLARNYLFNKYRVLLTRAREGMVLWIPPGDLQDPTRDPSLLDATAYYLHAAGVPLL
jgi:Uncharacterized conserved protein (DUF2075)